MIMFLVKWAFVFGRFREANRPKRAAGGARSAASRPVFSSAPPGRWLRVPESLPVVFSGKEINIHTVVPGHCKCLVLNLAASSLGPAPQGAARRRRDAVKWSLFGKIGKLCNADAEWALAVRPSDPPTRSP